MDDMGFTWGLCRDARISFRVYETDLGARTAKMM